MSELKDKILEEYKNGNVIIATSEGLQGTKLSEFIKQPTDGLLYDLNRNEAVVLTFIDDPKWINDYAVCQVIRSLKSRIDELEQGLKTLLQEPDLRDQKGIDFFLSDGNILPNGDLTSFLYGAKKYHDYLQIKIDKIMYKDEVKNNEKYSIPIYENEVKTEWTIDGIKGDEKYFELLKYGNGKELPDMVNVEIKK